jgi:hypothetical protein
MKKVDGGNEGFPLGSAMAYSPFLYLRIVIDQ